MYLYQESEFVLISNRVGEELLGIKLWLILVVIILIRIKLELVWENDWLYLWQESMKLVFKFSFHKPYCLFLKLFMYLECIEIWLMCFFWQTIDSIINHPISWQLIQIAEDYSHCEFLIRLPGYCPSMLVQTHPKENFCWFIYSYKLYTWC